MALTRARFVAGDASLGAALAKTVRKTLTGERGAAAIAQATRAIRGLIASYPWAMGRFTMMRFCLILCGWLALKVQDYQLERMKKIGMGPRMWRAGSGRQTGRRPLAYIGAL